MTPALSPTTKRLRLLILIIYIVLGVIYAFATPILEKPDEESHAWFVRYLASGSGLPVQVPGTADAPLHREGSQPPLYYSLSTLVWRMFDTSDFDLELQPNASPSFSPYGIGNKNLLIITPEKRAFDYQGTTLAILVLRLLGMLPGCVTVWFTFGIACALTQNQHVGLLASALTALNPMFINVTGALGNDGLVIALSTVALYMVCKIVLEKITVCGLIVTGIIMALACLTKVSGMVLLPVAAVAICGRELLGTTSQNRPWSRRILTILWQGSLLLAIFLVIAGWWYVRNLYLYNDFTGTTVMAQMMTPRNYSVIQAISEFGGFAMSYIAMFAHFAVPADNIVYVAFDANVILACIGLVAMSARRNRLAGQGLQFEIRRLLTLRLLLAICLALHVAFMLLSILRWTMMTPASQGRLLFPAIGANSTFMATGLLYFETWFTGRRVTVARAILPVTASFLFLLAALTPWRYIIPAYAPPLLAQTPDDMLPATQHLGSLADLLGYRVTPRDIHPGEKVHVAAIFRVRNVPRSNYLLVVKLYGRDNVELARFDTFTGSGLYPSSQWHTGDLWQDDVELTIPQSPVTPAVTHVQFDLYNRGAGDIVKSTDAQGHKGSPLFDASTLLPAAQADTSQKPPLATVGDIGVIIGYTHTLIVPGRLMTVTLDWRVLKQADRNYTVFVHLLDSGGQMIAQHDGEPAEGNFVTTRWSRDVAFADSHPLFLPADLAPGIYTMAAGVYDPTNGVRLVVRDSEYREFPEQTLILDHVEVR